MHRAVTKITRTYQTSSWQTSHCWTSSHTWLISLLRPTFSSRRLATYFLLPRLRRLPGNRHNTTARLSTQWAPVVSIKEWECARIYTLNLCGGKKKKKKGAMNSFRLIEADGKCPFGSQGPPLDSSVNIVLCSLGICGGAANHGQFLTRERKNMNENITLKDICF